MVTEEILSPSLVDEKHIQQIIKERSEYIDSLKPEEAKIALKNILFNVQFGVNGLEPYCYC